MVEPYEAGIARGRSRSIKTDVSGRIVVVLDTRRENRHLELIHPFSRCVRAGDVHELVLTDDTHAQPGSVVNRVAGVGFLVFDEAGVLMVGDAMRLTNGQVVGTVVGFDNSHYPNHFNIVLYNPEWLSGRDLGLTLDAPVLFAGQRDWEAEDAP